MYYFYSGDPNGVYPRFLVLIFIVSGCLGCGGNLAGSRGAVVLCRETSFGARRSISLYHLLITFIQALRVSGRSMPIREIFSSGFRDLIRLLINAELF